MKIRGQWGFSHTTLSHTISHAPLSQTQPFTHNFVTPPFLRNCATHHLSRSFVTDTQPFTHNSVTPSFTHQFLTNNSLYHTQLCHTQLFGCNFQGYGSSTISFVHSCRFNFCFCLLEDIGLWCYPVPYCHPHWDDSLQEASMPQGPPPHTAASHRHCCSRSSNAFRKRRKKSTGLSILPEG